jgi:hypothetical protein
LFGGKLGVYANIFRFFFYKIQKWQHHETDLCTENLNKLKSRAYHLLVCDPMWSGRDLPMFRSKVLPPSSGPRSIQSTQASNRVKVRTHLKVNLFPDLLTERKQKLDFHPPPHPRVPTSAQPALVWGQTKVTPLLSPTSSPWYSDKSHVVWFTA